MTGVHKDYSIEASEPLHDQQENVVLNSDIFMNRVTFYVWITTREIGIDILLGILLSCVIIIIFSHSVDTKGIAAVVLFFCSIPTIPWIYYNSSWEKILATIELHSQMTLYCEVIKYRACSDPKTWDIIAANMYRHFAEEGIYLSLYDGRDYLNLFMKLNERQKITNKGASRGKMQKTASETTNVEVPMQDMSPSPSDQTESAPASNSKSNENDTENAGLLDVNTLMEEALSVFRQAETDYWIERYPEVAR
ncbi:similar to Saccharomyces cerevisiae YHL044W Putative integral membrane protein, member of DUP240 gene family [Maudiozyma saulgeensis]|uniref:Similar to Saccharomyces cerevisiae YHL044W Putative integral membrane protein, member of DUP240 gene family n=1 Tax=Maudiozyma saulgeensis TaxID=1789683 RepID=A0A1X7R1V4_9SACH|nr:similar to Saccharomyces cerevisiae YHL044W Putative integral membrane protein, member of DUP240 gene family [Kazachstania saulgeensis]